MMSIPAWQWVHPPSIWAVPVIPAKSRHHAASPFSLEPSSYRDPSLESHLKLEELLSSSLHSTSSGKVTHSTTSTLSLSVNRGSKSPTRCKNWLCSWQTAQGSTWESRRPIATISTVAKFKLLPLLTLFFLCRSKSEAKIPRCHTNRCRRYSSLRNYLLPPPRPVQ